MNLEELKSIQSKCCVRIVDDNQEFLDSLNVMLSMKGWNVKPYNRAAKFLREETFRVPGCLVLDMRMPEMTGLELQHKLQEIGTTLLPIVFLTGHGDVESAVYTLKKGAFDFLQKPVRPAVLFETVENACIKSVQDLSVLNESKIVRLRFDSLTPREKEVFIRAANGQSNKEISSELSIAIPTVKMHRANAFDKMGVHSSLEASKLGFLLGGE